MARTRSPIEELFDGAARPRGGDVWGNAKDDSNEATRTIRWGPFLVDLRVRVARWTDQPLDLTPLELRIFTSLVCARGAVVSHQMLAELIWGRWTPGDDQRLHAHARRIRRKLEAVGCPPGCFRSIRGEGYRLVAGDDDG